MIPQRGDVANLVQLQYHQPKAAEYPFQSNLCVPPQGVNFDLTHKRGKSLYLILLYAILRVNVFLYCFHQSFIKRYHSGTKNKTIYDSSRRN